LRAIDNVISRIPHLGDSISDAHVAAFAPPRAPGVFQNPYPVGPLIVIPTDQDDGMVYVRTLRARENTARIVLKSGIYADGCRNRSVVINGLFYGLNGWNAIFAAYECPRADLVGMGVGTVAGRLPGHIGEICFGDRSGLGFAGRFLPLMIIVGPPSTFSAVPALRVT